MQASEEYMPFMNLMREKIAMSKVLLATFHIIFIIFTVACDFL